jgi:hypothetical protein
MSEWSKIKSFLWGGLLGGLLGLVLAPRRRVPAVNEGRWRSDDMHAFSEAPCYRDDDEFT